MSLQKLFLDTRWYSRQSTGVGQYVYHCAKALSQSKMSWKSFGAKISNEKNINITGIKKKVLQGMWKTIHFPPLNVLIGKDKLFHATNATLPPQYSGRSIVTVHDLAFVDFPETIESKNLYFLQKFVYPSLVRADKIIAVSKTTKKKIIQKLSIPADKIEVVYNGVDEAFFASISTERKKVVKRKYCLQKKYFLSISTIEPRKDYLTQIRAYEKLPRSVREEYDLVIAGGRGWKSDPVFEAVASFQRSKIGGNIRLLGYVDFAEIPVLLQSASMYLHTSVDEGFGIPLLQALACRCSVIASYTSCHPEILGDHAKYFKVSDPVDLAKSIESLLNTSFVEKFLDDAQDHAKKFSWERMGLETLGVYKKSFPSSI